MLSGTNNSKGMYDTVEIETNQTTKPSLKKSSKKKSKKAKEKSAPETSTDTADATRHVFFLVCWYFWFVYVARFTLS